MQEFKIMSRQKNWRESWESQLCAASQSNAKAIVEILWLTGWKWTMWTARKVSSLIACVSTCSGKTYGVWWVRLIQVIQGSRKAVKVEVTREFERAELRRAGESKKWGLERDPLRRRAKVTFACCRSVCFERELFITFLYKLASKSLTILFRFQKRRNCR